MPQFKLIEIIGVLVALAVLVGAVTAAWKMAYSSGHAAGKASERAEWQARESKELAAANAMILIESDKARKAERQADTATNEAATLRRKLDAAAKEKIKPVADSVAAGLARMCDPGAAAGKGATDNQAGAATDPRPGNDAGGRSKFFAVVGSFLSSEAARADEITRKLKQTQQYIRTALETCNAP